MSLSTSNADPQAATSVTRVVCVDDHAFMIEGLKCRLRLEPDIDVVAYFSSADELLGKFQSTAFDVGLIDVDMPGHDAFDAIESLRISKPDVRWIVLSAHIRDSYIDSAIQAGAIGYLSKREEPTAIVNAIRAAMRGDPSFSREVLERYNLRPGQERDLAAGTRGTRLASLTPREVQVLRLIGQGLQRTEIANMIHRSPKTIDVHRGRIMDKLGIHDRVELVRFCIREGIVSP